MQSDKIPLTPELVVHTGIHFGLGVVRELNLSDALLKKALVFMTAFAYGICDDLGIDRKVVAMTYMHYTMDKTRWGDAQDKFAERLRSVLLGVLKPSPENN